MDIHSDIHRGRTLADEPDLGVSNGPAPCKRRNAAPQSAPKAELSEEAWFHILWFSAAMLGMPALIATLILLF